MFRRILVPVDLSEVSVGAVDVACKLAVDNHGELILLHVIETIEHAELDELRTFYSELEKRAAARLDSLAEQASQRRVPAHVEIIYGKRGRSIVEYASNHRVDLVVLNSHRAQLERPGLGLATISYEVAALAPCPVLLLK